LSVSQSDVDRLWEALAGWAADARADEAARARAREGWLRRQAETEATFTGLLVDLAERHAEVVLDLAAGEHVARGWLRAVGRDVVVLATRAGRPCLVATTAIVGVRAVAESGLPAASGDRNAPLTIGLADALGLLAGERAPVQLVLAPGGRTVTGVLLAAGVDVVTVQPAGARPGSRRTAPAAVAVPLAAVALCQLA
jgi:hypothetical protein